MHDLPLLGSGVPSEVIALWTFQHSETVPLTPYGQLYESLEGVDLSSRWAAYPKLVPCKRKPSVGPSSNVQTNAGPKLAAGD